MEKLRIVKLPDCCGTCKYWKHVYECEACSVCVRPNEAFRDVEPYNYCKLFEHDPELPF